MNGVLQATVLEPRLRVQRLALAGCGTVGGALIRLLRERRAAVEHELALRFDVSGVLVRDPNRPRLVESAAAVLTDDLREWLAQDADVVVEATGARDTALQIARATLARGRRFVTANKALIATHGPELATLARATGGRLHFEAAVGGGVPVIRVLREALRHTGVRAIRGVLNGTSNYVLTRLAEGEPLEEALYQARQRGFAEADASRDLDGRDAGDKIAILAWLAFGIDPAAVQVHRQDFSLHPAALLAAARAHGGVLRQVAECAVSEAGVSAAVEPVILPASSQLARTLGEENCVCIETRRSGTIALSGPGAGGQPTAAALLSDLLAPDAPEPAARAVQPQARADDRAHSWAVVVEDAEVAPVFAALAGQGVGVQWVRTDADGRVHALTSPAERGRVAAAVRALEQAGVRAVAVRTEVAGA